MTVRADACFLPSGRGRLYATVLSADEADRREWVLHVPAFAEEMNKSRRMVSETAKALAEAGRNVMIVDLYGTGDSEGDFGDADWEAWLEDLSAASRWIAERGGQRVTLWGLRLGCGLAAELAASMSAPRLLLWQPIVSGQSYLTQFLRLRTAGQLFGDGRGESVQALRAELEQGKALEVAGYRLRPELARRIDALDLGASVPPPAAKVHWLEIGEPDAPIPASTAKVLERWRSGGAAIDYRRVTGEKFWATQEIATAPELAAESVRALAPTAEALEAAAC